MHSVPRESVPPRLLLRSLFRRISRDTSVPASGATAAEFVGLFPRVCTSSVPLRSVASEYSTSPRNALRGVFRALKRAAAARKCRRIAVRLDQGARRPDDGYEVRSKSNGLVARSGRSLRVKPSKRLQ